MFIRERLMNELSDGGDNGGESSSETPSAGDSFSGEEIIGTSSEQAFKDHGLDPAKYGVSKETDEEPVLEDDSQGSEEVQKAGQAIDEKSFLDRINSMELVHNGAPFKVESVDEVKNGIQMLKDYTVKTQALSEERKALDAEKSQTYETLNASIQEHNETLNQFEAQIKEFQQWQFTLNEMKESAPDVFEEVQRAFNGASKQFSNPILDQQLAAVNKRLEEAEKKLSSREDKLIVDSFESDFAALKATEQSLKELGITVNKDEVKKEWVRTGLPVKQVLGSLYFDQMTKAQSSRTKVETTKAKVAAKPTGAASASRPGKREAAIAPTRDYFSMAHQLLQKHSRS